MVPTSSGTPAITWTAAQPTGFNPDRDILWRSITTATAAVGTNDTSLTWVAPVEFLGPNATDIIYRRLAADSTPSSYTPANTNQGTIPTDWETDISQVSAKLEKEKSKYNIFTAFNSVFSSVIGT